MGAYEYAQYIHKDFLKGCLAIWEMEIVWISSFNWERISAEIQLFNTIYIHLFSPRAEGLRKRNNFFLPSNACPPHNHLEAVQQGSWDSLFFGHTLI